MDYNARNEGVTRTFLKAQLPYTMNMPLLSRAGSIPKCAIAGILLLTGGTLAAQDGALDPSFNIGSGFEGSFAQLIVHAITVQADDRILVGGSYTSYAGQAQARLARLHPNGDLDLSLSIGTGFSGPVFAIATPPDGKILACGAFSEFNGQARNQIARLNSDGTLDDSFVVGLGFTGGSASTIAVQADGKVLVGGQFLEYNWQSHRRIARLNTNGSIDPSFNTGTGFNGSVRALALQTDGKVIAAGSFTTYDGQAGNGVVRLNTDGTLDTSFDVGTGTIAIASLALQPDGRILAGGQFEEFNDQPENSVVRLNTDGSMDTTFGTGTGCNGAVQTIALQPDGRVLVGGAFTSFNGQLRNRIVRLNADGSLDTAFSIGTGFNSELWSIAIQDDGNILAGGWFTSFNGQSRNRIARLLGSSPSSVDELNVMDVHVHPNPATSTVNIRINGPVRYVHLYTTLGELVRTSARATLSVESLPAGVYLLHVGTANGLSVARLVKE